jgi:hypothetical protein
MAGNPSQECVDTRLATEAEVTAPRTTDVERRYRRDADSMTGDPRPAFQGFQVSLGEPNRWSMFWTWR